jgi:hypothetical protein
VGAWFKYFHTDVHAWVFYNNSSVNSKKQDRDSLVSVVADLRQAPLSAARIIAETLLLLQVQTLPCALGLVKMERIKRHVETEE